MGLNWLRERGQWPLLVGHRGASAMAPENTMVSFERALADGADALEMDVWISADGHAVVIHDETVDRTTDGTGKVKDMSLADLRKLDAGSWFDPQFAGEKIPTLDEVLGWAAGKLRLILELKYSYDDASFDPELAPVVVKLIQEHRMVERVIFISYQTKGLEQVRTLLPGALLGPMPKRDRLLRWTARAAQRFPLLAQIPPVRNVLLRPLRFTQSLECNVVAANVNVITRPLVDTAHEEGLPVSPGGLFWNYPRAIALNVDTIASNNPKLVRQTYLRLAAQRYK